MPATFPSHQGAALPLKLWRPRWFDGVALAVGAAAPDVAYAVDGTGWPVWPLSHEPVGLLAWCLPVTVTIVWLLRRAAPIVAAHLPRGGPFALRDYGALRNVAHPWWITGISAVLGAGSHLVLDIAGATGGPLAEVGLHVAGALTTALVLLRIGRRRLILEWHGPAPGAPRHPVLFWSVACCLAAAGALATPYLPAAHLAHTTGVRLIAVGAGALLLAAACTACVIELRRAGWTRDRLPH